MDKRVTLDDIAKKAGVSKNTVSVVLRGKPGVSEALRRQILDLAANMKYSKNAPSQRKYVMALLSDAISSHIRFGSTGLIPRLYFTLNQSCQENDCIMISYFLTEEMVKNHVLPDVLQTIDFIGIVTIGHMEPEYLQLLKESGQHVVMAHEYIESLNIDSVMSDDIHAGYTMTKYLIDLGHKRIAYFGEKYYMAKYMDRWQGYCRAMEESRLPIIYNSYNEVKTDRQTEPCENEYLTRALDELNEMPTAIVCGEDFTATRIKRILGSRGYRFPQDISFVGFDDVYNQESDLQITTYRVDHEELILSALKLLLNKSDKPRRITVFGQPVYRNSAIRLENK